VRIPLNRGMKREAIGHVAALACVRVGRGGRMICVGRQAAVVRRHVGAILAIVAIDVDWLGTG